MPVRRELTHAIIGVNVEEMDMNECDVIIVGGGNAALCAALSAREAGARVQLLERAPSERRG